MKLSEQKSYDQESEPFYPRPTVVSGDMIDLEGVSMRILHIPRNADDLPKELAL